MTARILVVDDEPDLETLIVQRFRRQIREGRFSFVFARMASMHSRSSAARIIDMVSLTSTCPEWTG